VPAGEHRVEFVFDPVSVKLGAGISALSLIVLASLDIAGFWKGRKQGKPEALYKE